MRLRNEQLYANLNGYVLTLKIEDPAIRRKIFSAKCNLNREKDLIRIFTILRDKYNINFVKVLADILNAEDLEKLLEKLRENFGVNEKELLRQLAHSF